MNLVAKFPFIISQLYIGHKYMPSSVYCSESYKALFLSEAWEPPPSSFVVQFSSVAQLCLTLWDPMNCSTPGFPVHHQLPELAQTHVNQVGNAIQPSHPLSSPSPPSLKSFPASGSFPVSQFFTSGGQSIGVSASTSVLPKNIQDWFHLGWTVLISLQSKGLSRVFSNTTVQKHQFFDTQLSL